MNYWDQIFATYHPPVAHHPCVCPGCHLASPRWGTPVEPERLAKVERVRAEQRAKAEKS